MSSVCLVANDEGNATFYMAAGARLEERDGKGMVVFVCVRACVCAYINDLSV